VLRICGRVIVKQWDSMDCYVILKLASEQKGSWDGREVGHS
jgi:hypothetical protein